MDAAMLAIPGMLGTGSKLQSLGKNDTYMGVSSHGDIPIAGWLISWKIFLKK
jgi:hypothetical protein